MPTPVISGALEARFRSQDPEPFANKLLAMIHHELGDQVPAGRIRPPGQVIWFLDQAAAR